jgi:hypothetical protein
MLRRILAGMVLGVGLCCGVARAEAPVIVWIGSTRCFAIRQPDGKLTPQQRADGIQDIFIKYLGGSKGVFTTKPAGKKVNIYLNGDYVIAATPQDLTGGKWKTPAKLAAEWKASLLKAFNETKAAK